MALTHALFRTLAGLKGVVVNFAHYLFFKILMGTLGRLLGRSKCHLLELPPEIRNQIYELALTNIRPRVKIADRRKDRPIRSTGPPPSYRAAPPALTRVCRQLRQEVLPLYYDGLANVRNLRIELPPDIYLSVGRKTFEDQVMELKPLEPHLPFITTVAIDFMPGTGDDYTIFLNVSDGVANAALTAGKVARTGCFEASHAALCASVHGQESGTGLKVEELTRLVGNLRRDLFEL